MIFAVQRYAFFLSAQAPKSIFPKKLSDLNNYGANINPASQSLTPISSEGTIVIESFWHTKFITTFNA